jgi:hypothetical protein
MRNYKIFLLTFLLGLTLLAAGCTLPASYQAEPKGEQNAAYTAAAETISAQLTELTAPTSAGTTPTAVDSYPAALPEGASSTAPAGAPTETLPNTSTPLPSSTPIPSDTPTITPTGTNTLTPTSTPVLPTSTPTSENVTTGLGEPDWTDSFQTSANWPVYTDEHVEMSIANNHLSMTALKANSRNPWDAWMLSWPQLTNFYLQATITPGQCQGLDRYGLLARAPGFEPISAYLFGVSCDGKYSLRIWNGKTYTNLITWKFDGAIKLGPDQTNVIGLRAEGSSLSLIANDYVLAKVEDDTFASGYFGLFVGAAQTDNFNIQVSNISYWELP